MNPRAPLEPMIQCGDAKALAARLSSGEAVDQHMVFKAMLSAIEHHQEACLDVLIKHDAEAPHWFGASCVRCAIMHNSHACLRKILQQSPLKGPELTKAIREAAAAGHVECLSPLLGLLEKTTVPPPAIMGAALHGHADCVALLWSHSRPRAAFERCVSNQSWAAADLLSAAASHRELEKLLFKAHPTPMPRAAARLERHVLGEALDVPADPSPARARRRV